MSKKVKSVSRPTWLTGPMRKSVDAMATTLPSVYRTPKVNRLKVMLNMTAASTAMKTPMPKQMRNPLTRVDQDRVVASRASAMAPRSAPLGVEASVAVALPAVAPPASSSCAS